VSWYQKKHSPTHTYRGHQSSLICFLHLLRSTASSFSSRENVIGCIVSQAVFRDFKKIHLYILLNNQSRKSTKRGGLICCKYVQVGRHGIRIEFYNEKDHRKTATYLPEVPSEQGLHQWLLYVFLPHDTMLALRMCRRVGV